jgi:O-antigen/teichoic acid export membrane protein
MLALRLFQRGLGLISTLILARLLIPEDFGVVAIVTLIGLLFNILSQTGSEQYIIQKQSIKNADLNTAWSLDLLLKAGLWLLFLFTAPLIAEFYEDESLTIPLQVSSLALIIGSTINPGIYLLKKNLQFGSFVKLEGVRKICSFAGVMLVLIISKSYWAIIIGDLISISIAAIGSYIISPFRPRFSLNKLTEQWGFSCWMLLKGIFGFSRAQIDTFLVSKIFGIADLGKYHMSKHVAYIPANDVIIPATEPVLSALAASKHDINDFRKKLSFSLMVGIFAIAPFSAYLYFYADTVVDLLLGEKWTSTYTLMGFLGIALFATTLNHILETSLIALGRVRAIFIFDVISMFTLASLLYFWPGQSIEDFTLRRSGILLVFSASLTLLCYYYCRFPMHKYISYLLVAFLSSASAIKLTQLAESLLAFTGSLRIFLYGTIYITTYILVLSSLLFMSPAKKSTEIAKLQSIITNNAIMKKALSLFN